MIKTNNPPKDREFLGLVENQNGRYWDFFWWARKEDGVPKGCFVDRDYYDMPKILGWIEVPDKEIDDDS